LFFVKQIQLPVYSQLLPCWYLPPLLHESWASAESFAFAGWVSQMPQSTNLCSLQLLQIAHSEGL
jgi:hypothetical protein